jgi:hypothetical protein
MAINASQEVSRFVEIFRTIREVWGVSDRVHGCSPAGQERRRSRGTSCANHDSSGVRGAGGLRTGGKANADSSDVAAPAWSADNINPFSVMARFARASFPEVCLSQRRASAITGGALDPPASVRWRRSGPPPCMRVSQPARGAGRGYRRLPFPSCARAEALHPYAADQDRTLLTPLAPARFTPVCLRCSPPTSNGGFPAGPRRICRCTACAR